MKERPIIFNDEMVRAILEGRKTQTRRIMKPMSRAYGREFTGWVLPECRADCPFGQPGDRLWVRECFAVESCRGLDYYDPPHKDGRPIEHFDDDANGKWWRQPHYRATDPEPDLWYDDRDEPGCRWKPSIHMPRKWSRIALEVTGVRVERLQEMCVSDAWAEGIESGQITAHNGSVEAFAALWQSIYGADSWRSNPWVWVVEFRRLECQA